MDKRIEVKYEDDDFCSRVVVYIDGEVFYVWNDNNNVDCPEDLTWSRMISNVFFQGIEAGKLLSKE